MRAILAMAVVLSGCQYIPGTDAAKIAEARNAVSADLTDPMSAQFRNEKVVTSSFVCGEVNAKNSFGGYAGYRQYGVRLPTKKKLISEVSASAGTLLCVAGECCDGRKIDAKAGPAALPSNLDLATLEQMANEAGGTALPHEADAAVYDQAADATANAVAH